MALDANIKELDFWEMTPAEVSRAVNARSRAIKRETKEKASYDYILATLIVKGVAICLGDKKPFPTLQEAYPSVFDEELAAQEEQINNRKTELSVLRFKQFAQSYNTKYENKEVLKENDE